MRQEVLSYLEVRRSYLFYLLISILFMDKRVFVAQGPKKEPKVDRKYMKNPLSAKKKGPWKLCLRIKDFRRLGHLAEKLHSLGLVTLAEMRILPDSVVYKIEKSCSSFKLTICTSVRGVP